MTYHIFENVIKKKKKKLNAKILNCVILDEFVKKNIYFTAIHFIIRFFMFLAKI